MKKMIMEMTMKGNELWKTFESGIVPIRVNVNDDYHYAYNDWCP